MLPFTAVILIFFLLDSTAGSTHVFNSVEARRWIGYQGAAFLHDLEPRGAYLASASSQGARLQLRSKDWCCAQRKLLEGYCHPNHRQRRHGGFCFRPHKYSTESKMMLKFNLNAIRINCQRAVDCFFNSNSVLHAPFIFRASLKTVQKQCSSVLDTPAFRQWTPINPPSGRGRCMSRVESLHTAAALKFVDPDPLEHNAVTVLECCKVDSNPKADADLRALSQALGDGKRRKERGYRLYASLASRQLQSSTYRAISCRRVIWVMHSLAKVFFLQQLGSRSDFRCKGNWAGHNHTYSLSLSKSTYKLTKGHTTRCFKN
ncbi:hypothetical protein DFH06DRAFT_1302162 [Mycena polygramma]|nr:hypothetical protein DFH06DRAFT_1302162 [Mycena polygramma]